MKLHFESIIVGIQYVDNSYGAAAGTGDGDVMMQFLPSYQAVEYLRQGVKDPDEACEKALQRIREKYEKFRYAIILATKDGRFGAACHGMGTFPFTVRRANPDNVEIITVKCIDS